MAVWSLREAAEQARVSKVDIWRAVRAGALPALKTHDGDYFVDSAQLFRVFETQQPEQRVMAPVEKAPPRRPSETGETPETATTDDMAVAFAALEAELRGLLPDASKGAGSPREAAPPATLPASAR